MSERPTFDASFTKNRPGRGEKRMLPSVSEVVRELSQRTNADPSLVFKAARQVCAEELDRIKKGQESAPLDALVDRAERLLTGRPAPPAATGSTPPMPSPLAASPAPAAPSLSATTEPMALGSLPAPPPPAAEPEDPFSETAGALDLRWDRDALSSSSVTPLAPPASAPPPPPLDFTAAPPATEEPAILFEDEPARQGPGEDTLNQLQEEAAAVDLRSVVPGGTLPRPSSVDLQVARPSSRGPAEPTFSSVPALRKPRRLWPLVAAVLVLAAAGAGAWYYLNEIAGGPPPAVVAARPRPRKPTPAPAEPTAVPSAAPTAAPTALPTPPPTPVPTAVPTRAPVAVAQKPAPPSRPTKAAPPEPQPVTRAGEASPAASRPAPAREEATSQVRAATFVTPSWAGRSPEYMVHFSSYREKEKAEREAARLSSRYGRPALAGEADLGERGTWYRVLVGGFSSGEEALAFRADLLQKNTPEVGFVYRVVGK